LIISARLDRRVDLVMTVVSPRSNGNGGGGGGSGRGSGRGSGSGSVGHCTDNTRDTRTTPTNTVDVSVEQDQRRL